MIFKIEGDGQYSMAEPDSGVEFRADHLRRDARSGEIAGELSVAAGILGARTVDGLLSVGSFNFSSVVARSQRAKLLRERARTNAKVDFLELLEAFCQYIAREERFGQPAVTLRDVPRRPDEFRSFDVLGLRFPTDHLSIVFGAGDTMKSYLALFVAAEIAEQGGRVLYCDWELDAEDHRLRLEAMCGATMPEDIRYCRCDRPLVQEVDRLRRIIRAEGISYVMLDSVAYGTQGDPAAADAAMDFCRAAGQLGVGKIAIAHITKNGDANDQMPYGSVFWHNSARMTWNVKKSDTSEDGAVVTLGCFNRKSNLGARRPAVGLRVDFTRDRVTFDRADLATIDDMVEMLPLWQRIRRVVLGGPQPLHAIASELNYENVDSLDRIVRKHKHLFTKITGADGVHRIALVERRAS
jgi:hypothetical protein